MDTPKISIIIPIYNVEDYLEETLNSILNQTFINNLEILMIDDGSTDNSRYIIEKYALDYDNFHAFHKQNEGSGISRNFGIKHANGEYVGFLDPDDLIAPDGYEKLYDLAIKNGSDIVTSNFTKFGRYNSWKDVLSKNSFGDLNHDIDSITLNDMSSLIWDTTSWDKIIKKDFLDKHNIMFPDVNMVYEDIPFTLRAYILADKISVYSDIFYYWRVRKSNNISQTQQKSNIKNFYDRVESIYLCMDILREEEVDDSLKNELYKKFLNHDLFLFLKKYYLYSDEDTEILLKRIKNLLNDIPDDIKDNLNSYKRIIYKMIENNDIEGLNYFSSLNKELMENPHIPPLLDEKYVEYIDFVKDASDEELTVKADDLVNSDENNIYIGFKESISYLNDNHPHETKAALIDSDNNEYPLDIDDNIIVPVDLIEDNNHYKIKMEYISENFTKESFLSSSKRQIINYDKFDLEIGIESNRIFCIDKRLTNENEIKINSITFENDILVFEGVSLEELDKAYLENVVTFEKLYYPISSQISDDGFIIKFSIPHKDILRYPVDKWEVRVNRTFKSISLPNRFEFYTQFNKIRIINARNKILIENDLYNKLQKLSEYYDEIYNLKTIKKRLSEERKELINKNQKLSDEKKELIKENKKLTKKNKKLNEKNIRLENKNENLNQLIEEYKSRFVVKSADKIKKIVTK